MNQALCVSNYSKAEHLFWGSFCKSFVTLGHYSGNKKRNNNTVRNNKKKFCESLETLLDLAAKSAEKKISGDRLRIEKAEKKDVGFLHDQRNAPSCKCPLWIMNQEKNGKENVKESKLKISK